MADSIVETIIVKLGLDVSSYNPDADKAVKKTDKLTDSLGNTDKKAGVVGKTLTRVFASSAILIGIGKLVDQIAKLNDEVFFLEKNLGMSSQTIQSWQGAASAMGGSADGMTSSMKSLNMSINDFVVMGDTSMLPFMNALGVSMVDVNGKARDTDKVMLDLADSFSKMDREQAFSLASKMGLDEGTFNTLVQGREEMEKMIEYQKTMYKSSEAELRVSRDLQRNRALLGSQWQSMKTMLANALMPLFLKASEVLLGLFEYLQKHQQAVKIVFTSIATVITAFLIPALARATLAALAFIAPFAPFILVVGALGAAFGLLYDDYKTWAEGGKSLFNWGAFRDYIDNSTLSTDNLRNSFKNLAKEMISSTIPTLKGYADIVSMLLSGDFKGAGSKALEMYSQFGRNIGDFVDDMTGQKRGSLIDSASNLFNTANTVGGTSAGKSMTSSGSSTSGMLGSVSSKYEGKIGSANRDVDQNGNPAGWAYGKFQFNSAKGGLQKFFSDNPDIAKKFSGLKAGTTEFNNKWKELARNDPKGFEEAQNKSAENLWYNPARDAYAKAGFDLNDRGVQEAIFSSSIQHGGVVRNLLPLIKKQSGDISKLSAKDQVKAIYRGRTTYHARGKGRYDAELKDALALSGGADSAIASMQQGTMTAPRVSNSSTNKNTNVDVKIDNINVKTSADTLRDTSMAGIQAGANQLFMSIPASR